MAVEEDEDESSGAAAVWEKSSTDAGNESQQLREAHSRCGGPAGGYVDVERACSALTWRRTETHGV